MSEHPMTPTPELVKRLQSEAPHGIHDAGVTRERHLAIAAYRAGADAELEACCEWFANAGYGTAPDRIRTARRPKPPSLAEQALTVISKIHGNKQAWQLHELDVVFDALKQLQELENDG